jgi:hypothetical protein
MQRRYLAALASLFFAAFWAALSWGVASGPAPGDPRVGRSLCALFVLLAAGLAAAQRWARWLGLAAAVCLLLLLSLAFVGTYFISLFGDQALELRIAVAFMTAIAFCVALLVLLSRPLDIAHPANEAPSARANPVWIPLALSAAYLVGSCTLGYYGGSGTWEGLAREIGVYVALLIALPSLVLLWLTWAWWLRARTPRRLGVLVAAGILIPFAVGAAVLAIISADAAFEKRKTEAQLANMHLSGVTDELLLSPGGNPIGIRLRYTVRFDEGLDDVRYRPSVMLRFSSPSLEMWNVRSETEPAVSDKFKRGTYRFTADFIPMYFPGFMRFPGAPQQADNRCFYWGNPADREQARDPEARSASVNLSFATAPDLAASRRSSSTHAYAQSAFYDGALAEGARECP